MLALDIGGANLKVADGQGWAVSRPFALWRDPQGLAGALRALLASAPSATTVAVTMTGELADCFATKAQGVTHLVGAAQAAAEGRRVLVYLTAGQLVEPEEALAQPLAAAASNWHALATFAGRLAPHGNALLVDIGSTTADCIPLVDAQPVALGSTDTERLVTGELVYTGVERTPLCGVVSNVPWKGGRCPVALEVFATMRDVYLLLGDLTEQPDCLLTADGRPATRDYALARLARMICADCETFSPQAGLEAAQSIADAQRARLAIAIQGITRRTGAPATVILSGQGEFLARRVISRLGWSCAVISLTEHLGAAVSQAACAHALAVLARERFP